MSTEKFQQLRAESNSRNEDNDCAVVAVAVVSGAPYQVAHEECALQGRRDRESTFPCVYHKALESLGYDVVPLNASVLGARDSFGTGLTATTIERQLRNRFPGRKFLVAYRGHVAAFDGTTLVDWTKGRRHRVLSVREVVPKGTTPNLAPKSCTARTPYQRGAVKAVWRLADNLHQQGKATRKNLLAAAEQAGINRHTASTQWQAWKKANLV